MGARIAVIGLLVVLMVGAIALSPEIAAKFNGASPPEAGTPSPANAAAPKHDPILQAFKNVPVCNSMTFGELVDKYAVTEPEWKRGMTDEYGDIVHLKATFPRSVDENYFVIGLQATYFESSLQEGFYTFKPIVMQMLVPALSNQVDIEPRFAYSNVIDLCNTLTGTWINTLGYANKPLTGSVSAMSAVEGPDTSPGGDQQ